MKNKSKRFVLGRAHVLSLALLAVGAIAGSALLTDSAVAQGAHGSGGGGGAGKVSMRDFSFTMSLAPQHPDFPLANEHAEFAVLLPAVQKIREAAARARFTGDGWTMELPLFSGATPTHRRFKIWVDGDDANGFEFHIANDAGEVRHVRALGTHLSVDMLPAVQSDGLIYSGESGTMHHVGGVNVLMADGSVRFIRQDVYVPPTYPQTLGNNLKQIGLASLNCGPVYLQPVDPDLPLASNERVEVSMLLPAVQKVREAAARMQLVGDGWIKEMPLYSGETPTHVGKTIYVGSANGGVWKTSVFDTRDGSVVEWDVPSPHFTIRMLPAVQSDNRTYEVQAATFKHHATGALRNVDGSNTPILIGLLLPAVQKIR